MLDILKKKFRETDFFFYSKILVLILVGQLFLRFYEIIYAVISNNTSLYGWNLFVSGFFFDISFVSFLYVLWILFYMVFHVIYPAFSRWSLCIFSILFLFFGFVCSRYYCTTLSPLDNVIFSYSLHDLILISKTEGGFRFTDAFILLLLASLLGYVFILLKKCKDKLRFEKRLLFVLLFVALIFVPADMFIRSKVSDEKYYTLVNKSYYFYQDIFLAKINRNAQQQLNVSEIVKYKKLSPQKQYVDINYPLLSGNIENSSLYSFFNPFETKANIVVIIVESLMRQYSGPEATNGNYTPFIDSLAQHSLYWENFISTSERTIGVLPSLLGSLPHAQGGFTVLGGDMPSHLSLASILKKNGYQTNFFYGGDISFDNMNVFISRQGFDHTSSGNFYTVKDLVYWGESDSVMFKKSMNYMDSFGRTPFLNVYLTLSTHGPYDFPISKEIKLEYQKIIKNLNSKFKKEHAAQKEQMIKSYLYTDNELKRLFYQYKSRPDFENTIFVITGDHGVASICKDNPLKKYHVPLIIYSEKLKKACSFKAMSSHYDVTPSILALLNQTNNLQVPNQCSWLGGQLDTGRNFDSKVKVVEMKISRELTDYISGKNFLSQNRLYTISDNLNASETKDKMLLNRLQEELKNKNLVESFVCKYDKLATNAMISAWCNTFQLLSVEKKQSLEIDSTKEYINILDIKNVKYSGNYKVSISFDYQVDSAVLSKSPIIAISANTGSKTISYSQKPFWEKSQFCNGKLLSALETSIVGNYKDSIIELRFYIWNLHRSNMKLQNVEIKRYKEN